MAAIKAGVTLSGADGLRSALNRLNDRVKRQAPETVEAVAYVIMENAERRTPVDTGALNGRSAFVDAPKSSQRYTKIQFGFAKQSPESDYALIQHENDDYNHRVGEAHYLLHAVEATMPRVRTLLAQLTRASLEP